MQPFDFIDNAVFRNFQTLRGCIAGTGNLHHSADTDTGGHGDPLKTVGKIFSQFHISRFFIKFIIEIAFHFIKGDFGIRPFGMQIKFGIEPGRHDQHIKHTGAISCC